MEDLPGNELRQHNACDCVICTPCLDRTIEHHQTTDTTLPKDHIKCPGCRQEAEPSTEFVTLDQIGEKNSKKKSFLSLFFLKKGFRAHGLMSFCLNLALAIKTYQQKINYCNNLFLAPRTVITILRIDMDLILQQILIF